MLFNITLSVRTCCCTLLSRSWYSLASCSLISISFNLIVQTSTNTPQIINMLWFLLLHVHVYKHAQTYWTQNNYYKIISWKMPWGQFPENSQHSIVPLPQCLLTKLPCSLLYLWWCTTSAVKTPHVIVHNWPHLVLPSSPHQTAGRHCDQHPAGMVLPFPLDQQCPSLQYPLPTYFHQHEEHWWGPPR